MNVSIFPKRPARLKAIAVGIAVVVGILVGAVGTVQAHTTRSGDYTKVSEGEIVRTSLFVGGRQIDIAGEVEGDVFCAGSNVNITGRVQGDVICTAQTVRISGTVDGDVRLASQDVVISGPVGGSLTTLVQRLELSADGTVGRDVSAFGSDVLLYGDVGRDVEANAKSLSVDGTIGRDIDAHTEAFNLNRQASVAGNINYASNAELRRDPAAIVSGRISRDTAEPVQDFRLPPGLGAVIAISFIISMLATTLLLVLVAPRLFQSISAVGLRNPGKAVLTGLVISLIVPVLIMILTLSVVGIPLAIALMLAWCLLLFLSGPIAAFMVGQVLLSRYRSSGSSDASKPSDVQPNPLKAMLLGSVIVLALYLVPFLNILVVCLVAWTGVGAFASWTQQWYQRTKK